MSNTIDQRVVEMQFDNRQFEKNVSTTIGTIDRLKKALRLEDSAKGLDNLDKAGKRVSFDSIAESAGKIGNGISAATVIGITALAKLTNSAIDAGVRIAKALTIEPVMTGLDEFETKINAIQVIKANTRGKNTMTEIETALDELNTYADKTIYNFAQMTSNVGKFVAQGQSVQQATKAVQGMANLAAASGASAEDMARATYQMSQALGGVIRMQDWNSLRNANMATVDLKNTLIDVAKSYGISIDQMIAKKGTFEKTLEEGWLTGDLFTEAMNIYSGVYSEAQLKAKGFSDDQIKNFMDLAKQAEEAATKVKTMSQLWSVLKETAQSGWTQSWENIIGNFDESSALFTSINEVLSNMINASSDARNKILSEWKELGGRNNMLQGFKNIFYEILLVIEPIKEAFREIFPPTTGKTLADLSAKFKELTSHFIISEESAENLKNTFKGIFAVVDIVGQAIGTLLSSIFPMAGGLGSLSSGILSVTGNFGSYLASLDETIKKTEFFKKVIQGIADVFSPVINTIKTGFSVLKEGFSGISTKDLTGNLDGVEGFANRIKARLEGVKNIAVLVGDAIKEIPKLFDKISPSIGKVMDAAFNIIGKIITIVQKVAPLFYKIGTIIYGAIDKVLDSIISAIESPDFNQIFYIINGGLFATILLSIKNFVDSLKGDGKGIASALGGITNNTSGFINSIKQILEGVSGALGAFEQSLKADVINKIAVSIAILAGSLLVLSFIDSSKLTVSLGAVTAMFGELFGSMAIFEKLMGSEGFKSIGKVTAAMISLSVAVLVLSFALKNVSNLSWEELAKGLIGVLVLVVELAAFLQMAKLDEIGVRSGVGLILLAAAMNMLAQAVSSFGGMDFAQMLQGLIGIGVVLAQLSIFTNLTGDASKVISTSIGLTILGTSMLIFAKAVGMMGELSIDTIIKGLAGMAGALLIIGVAINAMPATTILIGTGLVVVAAALNILASALGTMGGMSWEGIAKGLITLAGSLTIIAVAMYGMQGAIPGALALLVVSAGLSILSGVLTKFGKMKWSEVGKGLLVLASAFAVIGIAGLLLAPVTGALAAFGGALILIGAGIAIASAGLLLFAGALATLAVSGSAGAAALVLVATTIAGLIPVIIQKVGEGFVALVASIASRASVLVSAVVTIVTEVVSALLTTVPMIIDAVLQLLSALLTSLAEHTPEMVEAGFTIIEAFLQGLAQHIPNIVQAGLDMVVAILEGIANNIQQIVEASYDIVINFLNGIAIKLPEVIQAGINLALSFINGVADGIRNNTDATIAAVDNLMSALIEGFVKWTIHFLEKGAEIVKKLSEGISSKLSDLLKAGKNVVSSIVDGIKKNISDFASAAYDCVMGFIHGIEDYAKELWNAGKDLGASFIDGFRSKDSIDSHSDSKEMIGAADDTANGYIHEMRNREIDIRDTGVQTGKAAMDGTRDGIISGTDGALDAYEEYQRRYGEKAEETVEITEKANEGFESNAPNDYAKGMDNVAESTSGAGKAAKSTKEETDKLTDSLKSSIDMFASFDRKVELTPVKLLTNMQSQLSGFSDWSEGLQQCLEKGLDEGLYQKLAEMGPKSYEYVNAFLRMSSGQIHLANTMFNKSLVLPERAAKRINEAYKRLGIEVESTSKKTEKTVDETMSNVTDSMKEVSDKAIPELQNGVEDLGDSAKDTSKDGVDKLTDSVDDLGDTVNNTIPAVGNGFVDLATITQTLDDQIAKTAVQLLNFTDNAEALDGATGALAISLMQTQPAFEYMGYSMEDISDQLLLMAASFEEQRESIAGTIRDQMDLFSEFNMKTELTSDQLLKNMQSQIDGISKWAANMTTLAERGIDDGLLAKLQEMGPEGYEYVNAFVQMTGDELSKANSLYQQSLTLPDSAAKQIVTGYANAGRMFSEGFAQAINPLAATDAVRGLGENSLTELMTTLDEHSPSRKTNEMGANFVLGYNNGVKATTPLAKLQSQSMANTCLNTVKSILTKSVFHEIGVNVCKGMIQGIESKAADVAKAAAKMAQDAYQAACDSIGVHSPSTAFYDMGMYSDIGFANGLNNYSHLVEKSATRLGENSMLSIQDAINTIMSMMDMDIDSQPVITPVLDLSQVQNGVSDISRLMDINGNIGAVNRAKASFISGDTINQQVIKVDNNSVVDAITELRRDITDLSQKFENLQVVMDSGALVGEIINPIDTALGQKMKFNGRRM